jgi:hypothetical protein
MRHNSFVAAGLILAGAFGTVFADLTRNDYSDQNREVFLMPRAAVMQGADIALYRNAGPLSNPANLPVDSLSEISTAYAGYFGNTYSTAALSFIGKVDTRSAFGVSFNYILVPDIPVTTIDSAGAVDQHFQSSSDIFLRVSYGRKLWEPNDRTVISAGAALNTERKNLVGWTSYGIGLDAGITATYRFGDNSTGGAGLLLENLTSAITHWSTDYQEVALWHARFALGWQKELQYLYGTLGVFYLTPDLLSNEGINSTTNMTVQNQSTDVPAFKRVATDPSLLFTDAHYGVEYIVMNRIPLRAGLYQGTFSFGAGLFLLNRRVGFDFAYLNHELAPTYKLSVNYRWP